MRHITLSIHNLAGAKVCDLYDSNISAPGQAYEIIRTTELNGWKELSFIQPYMVDKRTNFRWKYIRNEYRLRIREDDYEDWYTISSPKRSRSSGQISNTVTCYHSSSILKTKNLYQNFDDTNGIDTCPNLVTKAQAGTGWALGVCDEFLERDGVTVKVRSLSSDGKVGSYQLITNICGLFNAYPIYHGATKTVDIRALSNKLPQKELIVGRNLSALSVDYNSDNIITRLYVEGEYGDNGYVGIDDVNPTGLTYLMNFDYYKELGLFTPDHQQFLDNYYTSIIDAVNSIKRNAQAITELSNKLNTLWGQPEFVMYKNVEGAMVEWYASSTIDDEDKAIVADDKIMVVHEDGTYSYITVEVDTDISAYPAVAKFKTPTSGIIGARETAIEAKKKTIESLEKEIDITVDETDVSTQRSQIDELNDAIDDIYNGTEDSVGLYDSMNEAIGLVDNLKSASAELSASQGIQLSLENQLVYEMGDMLKDGYWSNSNYIPGQEQLLYEDALEMMKELSKPQVSYTISIVHATDLFGKRITTFDLNCKARLYDPELNVNDIVFVNKIVDYLDNESRGSIEVSNDDQSLTGKSFDSILSRITQIADQIDQKASLYNRAEAINGNGQIQIDRLNGTIDVLRNRLLSSTSSWYTDDEGNIVFQSVNGRSAMMLTGEGFMIANGKTDSGDWNWRTFGTGAGFTADAIVTGYLSADRIEANSIGTRHLAQEITDSLGEISTLSTKITDVELKLEPSSLTSAVMSHESFQQFIDDLGDGAHISDTAPTEFVQDRLWLDTSVSPSLLKRCEYDAESDSYSWETVNDTAGLSKFANTLQQRIAKAEEKITDDSIVSTVTSSSTYQNQLEITKQSAVTQTVGELEVRFTSQDQAINQALATVNGVKADVDTWFNFSGDGQIIGKEGSPFTTKQNNQEYGFYHNGQKVAYMEGSVLNIPQAYARNILRIGGLKGTVDSEGNITWSWIGLTDK